MDEMEKDMTDRELKKLRRADLLEILVEQSREIEQLKAELEETRKELDNRTIIIEKAGSLAEAALQLNHIFEAADAAARQYLENVKSMSEYAETAGKGSQDDPEPEQTEENDIEESGIV